MRRALVIALASLVAAGCLEGPGGAPPDEEDVPFRSLVHQSNVAMFDGMIQRAITEEEWRDAWERHAQAHEPRPSEPDVDFARERVIAVSTGQKPAGCFDVKIDRVGRSADSLTIHVVTFSGPPPGSACAAIVVHPTHIISLSDIGSTLVFDVRAADPNEPWTRPTVEAPTGGTPDLLSARSLDRGSFSGIGEDTRALLRNEFSWEATWATHRPSEEIPFVEFPNESVIAVVEHGPTGCFGIHVGNVTYDSAAREILVEVVHVTTPPHVQCIQALQDAYEFVAIPDRAGEVRFVDRDEPGGGPAPTQTTPIIVGPEPTPPTSSEPGQGNYSFRSLASGGSSGIHEKTRRVVANESDWRAFWVEHAGDESEPPAVDFATERVFAALAGDKPNLCWALRVTRVDVRESNVNVEVRTYSPPADAFCAQAVSQPFHFVTYPITEKPLFLVEAEGAGPPPND